MSTLIFFTFYALIKGFISLNVITPEEILVPSGINSSLVLNCTYTGETYNKVTIIKWYRINRNTEGKLMATFSPQLCERTDEDVKNRSICTSYGPNCSSAIMYINDVRCEDGGDYRCMVSSIYMQSTSDTSVFLGVYAKTPTKFTMQPVISLEENYVVNFSCSVNVGNPPGVVRIWKQRNDIRELVNETSILDTRSENCSTIAHLSMTYKLTRHDQGAIFWCTSENKLIREPKRSTEIGPLNISYGPIDVSIAVSPDKTSFVVGDKIRLTCTADGNPHPTLQWIFNFTEVVHGEKYHLSESNSLLEFNIDNITDNGYYHCFASNTINGQPSNTSVNVTLTVQEKKVSAPSCSAIECSFTEKCYKEDNTAICSTDAWKITAFVFITLAFLLGMVVAILWVFMKLGKLRNLKKIEGDTRDLEERNYESLSNAHIHMYSTINEGALSICSRGGEGSNYESLQPSSGETHTYSAITPGGAI